MLLSDVALYPNIECLSVPSSVLRLIDRVRAKRVFNSNRSRYIVIGADEVETIEVRAEYMSGFLANRVLRPIIMMFDDGLEGYLMMDSKDT